MLIERFPTRSMGCAALVSGLLALSGCASLSGDGGMDAVSSLTQTRIGQSVQRIQPTREAISEAVERLLKEPLTAESAVQAALIGNHELQASLATLGIAEADFVQAGRLRNPGISFGRLSSGEAVEIERSILFDLAGLLTLPLRRDIEARRFEQARLQAAARAVQLATEVRQAYFRAVAAAQVAQYMEQVQSSAEAGAELGRRMARAGNWSKLDQAREQAFYADATAQVARARHQAVSSREHLTRLLGVPASSSIRLPNRLPDLPVQPTATHDAEQQAVDRRLDIQVRKLDAEATAKALGLSRATGFINVFEAGYQNKSETGEPRANGYEIELSLPLFDWGGARTARAEAAYMQAVHRTADAAVRARSQVREAYFAYRTTYDLARHYQDEIVPLRKRISEEVLLRYNGMLVGVFELLADARGQIYSVTAAIEAQRDFWIAEAALQSAIHGGGDEAGPVSMSEPAVQAPQGH